MKEIEQKHQIDILFDIFQYAYEDNLDIPLFVNEFLNSEIMEEILECSDIVFFNPITIYKDFIKCVNIKISDNKNIDWLVIRYIAFIYIKYHYRTKESFGSILKQFPVEDVITYFDSFHTLDEEIVIRDTKIAYNIKMNPMRKLRIKSSLLLDLTNDTKNLYIAKQLYLKLFDYPEIEALRFGYYQSVEFLQSETAMLYASTISSEQDIKDILNIRVLEYIRFNKSRTILFLFDELNLIKKEDIEKIFYAQEFNPYKECLIFSKGKIKYITNGVEYIEFYVPITSLDIRKIDSDYKNRFKIGNSD